MDVTVLKWVLIVMFGFSALGNAIKAAKRDKEPSSPEARAVAAIVNLGFIYWMLEVL